MQNSARFISKLFFQKGVVLAPELVHLVELHRAGLRFGEEIQIALRLQKFYHVVSVRNGGVHVGFGLFAERELVVLLNQPLQSMPDDIFYPTGTNVCVMVWTAHRPHDSSIETFFGYCKDDGFVKRKKLGRIDAYGKWEAIEAQWLSLYRNRDVEDGLSARHCVSDTDEWLCEAYMKTDYSKLDQADFQQTVNDYLAYLVRCGEVYESL